MKVVATAIDEKTFPSAIDAAWHIWLSVLFCPCFSGWARGFQVEAPSTLSGLWSVT
jgi:hypothetical protein